MRRQLTATPSPALHQVLSGRIGLSVSNKGGRTSIDCYDNLTGGVLVDSSYSGISHPLITSVSNAKKSRRADDLMMDHVSSGSYHHLKSSVDGNSSCPSTPLTSFSSKSDGTQDGRSSPGNGASPLFYQQSSSFRTPSTMMSGMMMAGSCVNDLTSVLAYHQTAPTGYYPQPYYHHLYPNPHHQPYHHRHPGYYQTKCRKYICTVQYSHKLVGQMQLRSVSISNHQIVKWRLLWDERRSLHDHC
ncbi:Uncharacterized protein APZ42_033613 [Daphnia magna]|uniref:Uncharacterized protein n=1 Tax=Daphnia magna TaxID=35525 RepID=A0A164KXG7_9CRUS|nr:Uncharacterized protein APZ42_033613 [Daphnia magna]